MRFGNPAFLGLLPVLVALTVYLARRGFSDLPRWRLWASVGLRCLLLTLVVLSLAGTQVVRRRDALCVVFCLDVSRSLDTEARERAFGFINRALRGMRPSDLAAVVAFADGAAVEVPPSRPRAVSEPASLVPAGATDIEEGLRLALATIPPGYAGKVVLLSDGNETRGEAQRAVEWAKSKGVRVDVVPLESPPKAEVIAESLTAPERLSPKAPFDLKAVVEASRAEKAKLRVLLDGKPVGTREVVLSPGRNVLLLPETAPEGGFHTYKVVVEPDRDAVPENNVAEALIYVSGRPRVLLVSGPEERDDPILAALKGRGIEVERAGPRGVPLTAPELASYDEVVLNDVPAYDLPVAFLPLVASGVRDLGVGLLMVGGPNSFGAGGYQFTPVEHVLPVSTVPRRRKEVAQVALVLVIDKSGSMGAGGPGFSKMDLAKEAAIATVETLSPDDLVGVVCFDFESKWVVPLTKASRRGAISRAIAAIQAGGGTSMYPALVDAFEALAAVKAPVKHIIALTDGRSEPGDFYGIAEEMAKSKMTLSTVAIGTDADVNLLREMARLGRGRFYFTADPRNVPRIFLREAFIVRRGLIKEGKFKVLPARPSPVLRGVDLSTAPPLLGYVVTYWKPRATVALASDKRDPILAHWQCGLGRALAFTSDLQPRWAALWLKWPYFSALVAQMVRYGLKSLPESPLTVEVTAEGSEAKVVADAVDEEGRFINGLTIEGTAVFPDMSRHKFKMRQTAPGGYEGKFRLGPAGAYMVILRSRGGQELVHVRGFSLAHSPEHRFLGPNLELLARVAKETGGKVGPSPASVYAEGRRVVASARSIWWGLLLAALLLLPLDIAVRRLAIRAEQLARAWAWLRSTAERAHKVARPAPTGVQAQAEATLRRLSAVKREARRRLIARAEAEKAPPTEGRARAEGRTRAERPSEEADTLRSLIEVKRRMREGKGRGS